MARKWIAPALARLLSLTNIKPVVVHDCLTPCRAIGLVNHGQAHVLV